MKQDFLRLEAYLSHIIEAVKRVESYIEDVDEANFYDNELVQDAVIRNLEIIGEASQNIRKNYPEFASTHPEAPFAMAYGMRNMLAHGYFKVDLKVVWKTIERDLPELGTIVSQLAKTTALR